MIPGTALARPHPQAPPGGRPEASTRTTRPRPRPAAGMLLAPDPTTTATQRSRRAHRRRGGPAGSGEAVPHLVGPTAARHGPPVTASTLSGGGGRFGSLTSGPTARALRIACLFGRAGAVRRAVIAGWPAGRDAPTGVALETFGVGCDGAGTRAPDVAALDPQRPATGGGLELTLPGQWGPVGSRSGPPGGADRTAAGASPARSAIAVSDFERARHRAGRRRARSERRDEAERVAAALGRARIGHGRRAVQRMRVFRGPGGVGLVDWPRPPGTVDDERAETVSRRGGQELDTSGRTRETTVPRYRRCHVEAQMGR